MNHYIIIKFKEDSEKEILIKEVSDLFDKANSIEGIRKVEVFTNSIKKPNRFDMMIKMSMNKKILKVFEDSEIYHKFEKKYKDSILSKTVFDC